MEPFLYNKNENREVICIYEIYIDIYFIENVLTDGVILVPVMLLLGEKIVIWRLALGALLGGAGAVFILLLQTGYPVSYMLMVLLSDCVMLAACMPGVIRGKAAFRKIVMGIIYLHGIAFAYSKLLGCIQRIAGENVSQIIVMAVISAAVTAMVIYHQIMERRPVYDVVLMENGENVEVRALLDTGNFLVEPLSGKPVSVVEEIETVKKWIREYPQKYKVIPYRSIGNEHGIMEGIVVDELIIHKKNEQVVKKETVVALYKGKLSKEGKFQMILNHSLI
jgi:sigma-E processing peptidase SpoIIGA